MDTKQQASIIHEADRAFLQLMQQVDHLFGACSFFFARHLHDETPGSVLVRVQLEDVVRELGALPRALAEVVRRWKSGEERLFSREGVEIYVLNELWANIGALIYFFASHEIDLAPFDLAEAQADWTMLRRCNQLLP
jgi:hypothetical protein